VLLEEAFDLLVGFVTRDRVTLLNQAGQRLFVAFESAANDTGE